jgi:phospholipid N-methyltransferase
MNMQGNLFAQEAPKEVEYKPAPFFDKTMAALERIAALAEEENRLIQALLDEVQEGLSEDEKLRINNPKEWARKQKETQIQEPIMAKELTNEAIECLKECKVEGLIVKLPEAQLDRKVYTEVRGRLELIGGKWKGGKVYGFVFQQDPTDLLNEIANGGSRNLKKEFQFFATPAPLADKLVELAEPESEHDILEPSAGQGAIVNAINRVLPEQTVYCMELMDLNRTILDKIPTAETLGSDFLNHGGEVEAVFNKGFDRIIANPPFANNQDIDHIKKMYDLLRQGGRLVSIASNHWKLSGNKKETEFRNWLDTVGAEIIEVPQGAFKESGTNIAASIIRIDKIAA